MDCRNRLSRLSVVGIALESRVMLEAKLVGYVYEASGEHQFENANYHHPSKHTTGLSFTAKTGPGVKLQYSITVNSTNIPQSFIRLREKLHEKLNKAGKARLAATPKEIARELANQTEQSLLEAIKQWDHSNAPNFNLPLVDEVKQEVAKIVQQLQKQATEKLEFDSSGIIAIQYDLKPYDRG